MFLVKDTIDKNKEGIIFTQWYASMCKLGIPIEWEDIIYKAICGIFYKLPFLIYNLWKHYLEIVTKL